MLFNYLYLRIFINFRNIELEKINYYIIIDLHPITNSHISLCLSTLFYII